MFLDFVKGMKVDNQNDDAITLRTSRCHQAFGIACLIAGIGLLWQTTQPDSWWCCHTALRIPGFATGFLLTVGGFTLLGYRQRVVMHRHERTLSIHDTIFLTTHNLEVGFDDVASIELCPLRECVCFLNGHFWAVKAYVHQPRGIKTLTLFVSHNFDRAREAGVLAGQILGRALLDQPASPIVPHVQDVVMG